MVEEALGGERHYTITHLAYYGEQIPYVHALRRIYKHVSDI